MSGPIKHLGAAALLAVTLAAMLAAAGWSSAFAQAQSAQPAPQSQAQAQPGTPAQVGTSSTAPAGDSSAAAAAERQRNQPGNNAPVWREVRSGQPNYTSIPGRETGVLIQSGGETWRERRNNQLIPLGGLVLAGVFLACALFYLWRGTIQLQHPETGRKVLRFTHWQRTVHWTVAITFSILAISGLTMAFGRLVLLPIIGHTLFALLTVFLKNMHNFLGPLFVVALGVMFFTFVRDNWIKAYDLLWLRKGGGLASGEHIPSDKFNAGEKLWFWGGLLFLGAIVSASGLVLDFANFGQTRATMQITHLIHLGATLLMMAASLGHIYMGTLGMAGAYKAMRTGYVDEEWAKEHHEYWYRDLKEAQPAAAPQAPGGPVPAAAPQAKEKHA